MTKTSTKTVRTSDLGLAAALVACGNTLVALDYGNHDRVEFVFTGTDSIARQINDYWSNALRVSPLAYEQTRKSLRHRIQSGL